MSSRATGVPGVDVDLSEARAWVRGPFAAGSRPYPTLPSVLLSEQLGRFGLARVLGASRQPDQTLNDQGHGSTTSRSDARAALRWARARGAVLLVVEDWGALRGDSNLRRGPELMNVAYVGDLVLRWSELRPAGDEALTVLEDGAFPYPRNGYVCDAGAAELGLVDDRSLSAAEVEGIAAAARGVITSVWDDESYVLLWSADPTHG